MKKFFTHNVGLKFIALILAIITYIYVDAQLLK